MARLGLTFAALLALLVALVGPAGAVDDTKPVACGASVKDPADDQANLQAVEGLTDSTEIIGLFAKHDASKGAEATTMNVVVKNFSPTIQPGATSMSWNAYYEDEAATRHFVRGFLDFSGAVAWEYGVFTPNPAGVGVTGVHTFQGTTNGKFFEGPEGVIQLVVPAEKVGPGKTMAAIYASTGQGRTAPSQTPGGQRGLSAQADVAPDGAPTEPSTYSFKFEPCAGGGASPTPDPGTGGGGGGGGSGGGGGGGGGGTTPPPPQQGPATLPIKISGKVKAPKRKSLKIKLTSTEAITQLAAQVRKGTKVIGRGKMARLNKKGTLTIRLSKKAKKGKYTLDLAGNRANGQRGVSSLSLRLR